MRKTDGFWREFVSVLAEEGYPLGQIVKQAESVAAELGRKDCPGERTVARLIKAHRALPESLRRAQGYYRWPESHLAGLLPWDAARDALDLVRLHDGGRIPPPTVRHAIWFHRYRLAVPTAPPVEAWGLSLDLALREYQVAIGRGTEVLTEDSMRETRLAAYHQLRDAEQLSANSRAWNRVNMKKDVGDPSDDETAFGTTSRDLESMDLPYHYGVALAEGRIKSMGPPIREEKSNE